MIIAFDMDGTLLNDNQQIHEETMKKIKELRAKKHNIVLASGRSFNDLINYATQDLVDYLVCNNGASVYDIQKKEYIKQSFISIEVAREFNKLAKKNKAFFSISVNGMMEKIIYTDKYSNWENVSVPEMNTVTNEEMEEILSQDELESTQCSLKYKSKTIYKWQKQFAAKYEDHSFFVANEVYLDANSNNVSKFNGIKVILDKLGETKESLIAFGDSQNDIHMLEEAKHSFAMGNSENYVKKSAKATIGNNTTLAIFDTLTELENINIL
ncbi:MAG: Cof-type HAD-IIB family hydrolase [Mycoplasma sp.]|nr:Cof-type HAD-IIB family hydrolase [Mycoplasma sp.]